MSHNAPVILRPEWLIPMTPEREVHTGHALVMDGERIIACCPVSEAAERFPDGEIVDLPGKILMPGLVNAHGHAAMSLFRGLADDLPLMTWLNDHIWPSEGRWVSAGFVEAGSRLAIAEQLLGGITCFSDMYFFPEVTARVAAEAGIRCQVAFPILDFPSAWASEPEQYLQQGLALIDDQRHSHLITVAFGPHAPYTVSDGPLQRVVTLAHQLDCPVQIHLHETATEVEQAESGQGMRPIARLEKLGLLTPQTQCVHMTQLNEHDLRILRDTGAQVVHCPQSNLKLASGFCPVDQLLKNGTNVAIGTDGAASNNDLDLWDELRTAALLAKAVAGDASALPAWQALEMATINGARALGLEEQCGSLTPGKYADCIALDLGALNTRPMYNLASHLTYATKSTQVSHVWVAGRCLVKDGQLTTLNQAAIAEETTEWQQRILGQ